MRLEKLNITQFRNYDALRLNISGAQMIVLTGPNGAGKTNILEAVSLLVPGKGLRGAPLEDLKSRMAEAGDIWGVAAEIEAADGHAARVGTGLDRLQKKRVARIDGRDAKSQSALSALLSAVWITPQMDRIFQEGPGIRRKFLDRLVLAYAPDHVTHLNRYEKNLRARMKLLQDNRSPDPRWLDALESQLAADAVSIADARCTVVQPSRPACKGPVDAAISFSIAVAFDVGAAGTGNRAKPRDRD